MQPPSEPRYVQLRVRRPASLWPLARALTVGAVAALAATLIARPELGLRIFWTGVLPVLPLLFLALPGLWRNICPMAAMNQLPRILRLTRARPLPRLLERHGYAFGLILFFGIASSRKAGLADDGQGVAIVLGAALALPLMGGLLFQGKSGFCGSICPLRPVQGLYGQTPVAEIENDHCKPCVGCTTNCTDLKPTTALRDELADDGRGGYMRVFAGAFPGFVLAFYTLGDAAELGLGTMYLRFGIYMLASLGLVHLVESLLRLRRENAAALAAGTAFSLFYYFNVPLVARAIADLAGGGKVPEWTVWEGRALFVGVALTFVVRTFRKGAAQTVPAAQPELPMAPAQPVAAEPVVEPESELILEHVAEAAPQPAPTRAAAKQARRPMAGDPPVPVPDRRSRRRPLRRFQVTMLPGGEKLEADAGQTLAEVVQGSGAPLQSGCQMGLCGCDPIYICDGGENLSTLEADERSTIERFGFPPQTRMACVTRIQGDVVISLDPEVAADAVPVEAAPVPIPALAATETNGKAPAEVVPAVARRVVRRAGKISRVVILGNGIAGVTAADHIRRHHAECQIDLVTDERHPFYNRTSVSGLIHDEAGMQNMYLLPQSWYEERRITSWLETTASEIDRKRRRVRLTTGVSLPYDKLIIATGARPIVPPIRNYGLDGCFTLRSADDAMLMRRYAQRPDSARAIVIGGGVLGLEAAESLAELGLSATVVERNFGLAPMQLDGAAGRILRGELEDRGIEIMLGASVTSLDGRNRVIGVELSNGERRTADLVLVAAGVMPNADLARAAGLKTGRGIIVDDSMRTSDPAIFAAGDVAEHRGNVYGLWPAAVEQAEIAAINAIGSGAGYPGSIVPTLLRLGGMELVSIGEPHAASGDDEIVLEEANPARYRKLILQNNMIAGAILLGDTRDASAVLNAVREERDVGADLDALRAGHWDVLNEDSFERAAVASMDRYRARDEGDGGDEDEPIAIGGRG